jgi:hypothetical protein
LERLHLAGEELIIRFGSSEYLATFYGKMLYNLLILTCCPPGCSMAGCQYY